MPAWSSRDPATLVGLGNLRNPTTALRSSASSSWSRSKSERSAAPSSSACSPPPPSPGPGLRHPPFRRSGAPAHSPTGRKTSFTGRPLPAAFTPSPATAFKLDIRGALNKGLLEIVFVFFFVDLFDNLGTLVAVTKRAGLIAADHSIPRLNRILFADATATVFGSLAGTSTVTSYVESTAGVMAGGRSGVTAIVTGLLFLGAIGAAPFVGIVPPAATAPALILVGSLMLATITEIRWTDPLVAVPAFLTLVLIPLTYSIANGLGFGIIAWAILHLATGKFSPPGLAALRARRALSGSLHLPGSNLGPQIFHQKPRRHPDQSALQPTDLSSPAKRSSDHKSVILSEAHFSGAEGPAFAFRPSQPKIPSSNDVN